MPDESDMMQRMHRPGGTDQWMAQHASLDSTDPFSSASPKCHLPRTSAAIRPQLRLVAESKVSARKNLAASRTNR